MDARKRVIEEAKTWLGTPYHHMGRVKGAGVDCCTFLIEVYTAAGLVPPGIETPFYRPDFMQHSSNETYLDGLLNYGHLVDEPFPADLALFKFGRVYAHAALIIDWPQVIHASWHHGIVWCDATKGDLNRMAAIDPVKFISVF